MQHDHNKVCLLFNHLNFKRTHKKRVYDRWRELFFRVHDITQDNKRCHLTKVKLLFCSTSLFESLRTVVRIHSHTNFSLCLNRCFHLNKWILLEFGDNLSTNVNYKLINHYNPFPSTSKVSPVKNKLFETDANHHIQTIHSMSNWLDSHLYSMLMFYASLLPMNFGIYIMFVESSSSLFFGPLMLALD